MFEELNLVRNKLKHCSINEKETVTPNSFNVSDWMIRMEHCQYAVLSRELPNGKTQENWPDYDGSVGCPRVSCHCFLPKFLRALREFSVFLGIVVDLQ